MKKGYVITLVIICLLLVGSIFLGTSYSLWQRTAVQEGTNEIQVGCFRVTFTNLASYQGQTAGDINLVNTYPLRDEDGASLTPYMFNIKNECSVASDYTINLETLNTSDFNTDYLRVMFANADATPSNTSSIYTSLEEGVITLTNEANAARVLGTGHLEQDETATYSLRVWIDKDATTSTPNVMGRTWRGKVVVTSEAADTLTDKTVTGTRLAYITDGTNNRIKGLEITGGTESSNNVGQDGTIDIVVSGKNLVDYRKFIVGTSNGVNAVNNNDGSLTFSGSIANQSQGSGIAGFEYSRGQNMSLFGIEGYYILSSFVCSTGARNYSYPQFYMNTQANGTTTYSIIRSTLGAAYLSEEMINASDYRNNFGHYTDINKEITPGTYCDQIERGQTVTEFEPYKENRYTIHLKDSSNNTISGLTATDTLKKVNGTWVIDNGSTQTILADTTQGELNKITLYDGISNVWVDDDVLITNIKVSYYTNNN